MVAIPAPITRTSSKGRRAERSSRRAIGITAKASAILSGPLRIGTLPKRVPPKSGFGPDATSISPASVRAAAAHDVGPWISRPLRSAMPPSRSFSSTGPLPLADAPFVEMSTPSRESLPPLRVGPDMRSG